jgi:hypothetical protein
MAGRDNVMSKLVLKTWKKIMGKMWDLDVVAAAVLDENDGDVDKWLYENALEQIGEIGELEYEDIVRVIKNEMAKIGG